MSPKPRACDRTRIHGGWRQARLLETVGFWMKRFGVLLFAASVERNLSSYVFFLGRLQTVVGAAVKVTVTDAFQILEGVRLGERFTDVFLTRFKVKRSFRARVARRRLRDIVRSGKDFRGPGSTIKGRQRSGGQVADCIGTYDAERNLPRPSKPCRFAEIWKHADTYAYTYKKAES